MTLLSTARTAPCELQPRRHLGLVMEKSKLSFLSNVLHVTAPYSVHPSYTLMNLIIGDGILLNVYGQRHRWQKLDQQFQKLRAVILRMRKSAYRMASIQQAQFYADARWSD